MAEKQPPHVEQALAELAATDNEQQKAAARKRMAAAGYEPAAPTAVEPAAEQDIATERKAAPKGRSTRQEAKGATT